MSVTTPPFFVLIAKTKRIAGLLIHPYHCERSGALAGEAIDGQIDVEAVRQASAAWERAQREQRTMDDFGRER
jgi:hypothetical protein